MIHNDAKGFTKQNTSVMKTPRMIIPEGVKMLESIKEKKQTEIEVFPYY
jgi:hypothetical protein